MPFRSLRSPRSWTKIGTIAAARAVSATINVVRFSTVKFNYASLFSSRIVATTPLWKV